MDQVSGRRLVEDDHSTSEPSSYRSSSNRNGSKNTNSGGGCRQANDSNNNNSNNGSTTITNSCRSTVESSSSSNNSNLKRNNKSNSYSKLFRQYLPQSLNLKSYALASSANSVVSSSSGGSSRAAVADCGREALWQPGEQTVDSERQNKETKRRDKKQEDLNELNQYQQKQQLVDTDDVRSSHHHQQQQQKQTQQSSIVSTLSRLRLTSGATGKQQYKQQGRFLAADREGRLLCGDDTSEATIEHANLDGLTQSAAISSSVSNSSSKSKLKRKGFLYLKSRSSSSDLIEAPKDLSKREEAKIAGDHYNQKSASYCKKTQLHKRRDLNNNSLSNLLNNNSNCAQNDDGHTTCLIEDDDEEEEEDDNNNNNSSNACTNNQQTTMFGKHRKIRDKDEPIASSPGSEKKRRTVKVANHSGKSATLILTGCLLSVGCLIAMIAVMVPSAKLLVMAQQSAGAIQSPFSRSQPAQVAPGGPIVGGVGSSSSRVPPQPAAGSLVASINCNKIRGHVTLTPNTQQQAGGSGGQSSALTTVSTHISAGPPGEVYQWSVHQFPVKPGAAMCSCSPMILGTKLIDLSEMHGNLPSDQEFSVQSSLNLFGSDSLVGHSLMLRGMKTGMVACATFLPTSRKSNYRAKFHTPISGSVTIFQTAFGTSFISHLMYSNGTRRHSSHRFDLVKSEDDIVTTSLVSGGNGNLLPPLSAATRAESLALEQREHEHELTQCRRFAAGEPLLRNMSYQLTVSTENFGMRGRTSMVLPQIPFETFGSVFVVIYSELDPGEPLACAPLKFVKPKTAAAKFQSVSVQGSVVFSQDSPYDPTVARINLNLPNSDGHSYGIDELPMIIRRKSDTRVCPNIREIIYNPHHVEPSSVPPEGEATSDQYAVGDLSGKYGSLTGKATEKLTVNDFNLPLYGPISIVGRAMTVYSAEGVAIACSNVELTTPMTTAFATFDFGIQGQFIFRQPVNDCNGDTYVYIEVSKPTAGSSSAGSAHGVSGSQPLISAAASTLHHIHANGDHNSRSLDHNWHIHTNPVDSGLDHLSTTDCLPAGPHFNPYNTSTNSIYSRDCTPFNVLRCELGDLSAKMFTIEIPPYRVKGGQEPDIGKFFGTDIDLPLCGPVSIVNRSVVVHVQDFGAQRLACSTVIEFKPRTS